MAINSAAKTRLRACSLFTWAHCLRWPGDGGPLSPETGLGGAWEGPGQITQRKYSQSCWAHKLCPDKTSGCSGPALDVVTEGDDPVRASQRIKPQPEEGCWAGNYFQKSRKNKESLRLLSSLVWLITMDWGCLLSPCCFVFRVRVGFSCGVWLFRHATTLSLTVCRRGRGALALVCWSPGHRWQPASSCD